MKTFVAFCVLLAVASAFDLRGLDFKLRKPFQPALAKDSPNERITHGKTAAANQFKYQVGLLMDTGYSNSWCGGSLIANEWVLTAAHCTVGAETAFVILGTNDVSKPGGIEYEVSKNNFIVHDNFDQNTLKADIALIKIPYTKYTNSIQNIALPPTSSSPPTYEGDVAVASGWGDISDEPAEAPALLQYADFTVISNALCEESYGPDGIYSGKLCTASTNSVATCHGDSGGPLALKNKNILIGVTSFGATDGCELNHPLAFTRITAYSPWIRQKTGLPL